jgi:predicted component of viral defense system (DUF524 family)
LPSSESTTPPLLDERREPDADPAVEPIQLLEGEEYRFEFLGLDAFQSLTTDRPEIFTPDDETGRAGRLRPKLYTGTLPIRVLSNEQEVARLSVEVRSRKLDYLRQYRWMLRDLAEDSAELVMARFGPAEQRFTPNYRVETRTAYQRFAFLRALIEGESFGAAIGQVVKRPYVQWVEIRELRAPNRGLRMSSSVARQLTRPGPRIAAGEASQGTGLKTFPKEVEMTRAEETLDNTPNRFVKFVLERWRGEVTAIEDSLLRQPESAPIFRGRREVAAVKARIDELLAHELFREVGDLRRLPFENPVLLSREGYRDVLDAYLKSDLAAQLAWAGGDDVYGAGQRDVATLYEYWVFLKLSGIISRLCRTPFDFTRLLELTEDGLSLNLARGRKQVLEGQTVRLGRRLGLTLWFNRQFPARSGLESSWTRAMRPDCSLQLRSLEDRPLAEADVWVHFDAKYRIEHLEEILGAAEIPSENEDEGERELATATRVDLLKMHAYRDAIRRSAGAYVIYPGDEKVECKEYHEILPGLGAFGLRPTENGGAIGASVISAFVDDVIGHVAAQVSQHERGRYWRRRVYDGPRATDQAVHFAPFLAQPPADTQVLLGYVKAPAYLRWIRNQRRYALPGDRESGRVGLRGKDLGADLLLLYGESVDPPELWYVVGEPEVLPVERVYPGESGHIVSESGMAYGTPVELADVPPSPSTARDLFLCLPIEPVEPGAWTSHFTQQQVEAVRTRLAPSAVRGVPVMASWLDLVNL